MHPARHAPGAEPLTTILLASYGSLFISDRGGERIANSQVCRQWAV